jgi:formylglycine-generating enzyme required for sulfatase activity
MRIYWRIILAMSFLAGAWHVHAAPTPSQAQSQTPGQQIWRLNLNDGEQLEMVWIGALGICVGRYEVTNGQYRRYNPAHRPAPYYNNKLASSRQPAVQVSWEDANNYAGWLNRNFRQQLPSGFAFRLPTEHEWTVYASTGTRQIYPWGNNRQPPADWNYRGEEGAGVFYTIFEDTNYIHGHNDGFIVSAPVESSGRNAWGLYGVGGNVWEWCANWLDNSRRYRVLRGGGWNNFEEDIMRLDFRSYARPEQKNSMVGFRLVLAPLRQNEN